MEELDKHKMCISYLLSTKWSYRISWLYYYSDSGYIDPPTVHPYTMQDSLYIMPNTIRIPSEGHPREFNQTVLQEVNKHGVTSFVSPFKILISLNCFDAHLSLCTRKATSYLWEKKTQSCLHNFSSKLSAILPRLLTTALPPFTRLLHRPAMSS